MSTEILTTITVYILVGGLSAALTEALYCRQLAKASVLAAAVSAAIHLVFVMSAWKEAAEEASYQVVSPLLTAVCDAPAWAAVVFLTTGIVLAAIQRHREKVAEKKLMAALTKPFGVNEPEENESEKD